MLQTARVALLLLVVVGAVCADDHGHDHDHDHHHHDHRAELVTRLRQYLFRDYDRNVIPVKEDNVTVHVSMSMINMDFCQKNRLHITAWLRSKWIDYRLQWNPAQFGNISVLRIPSSELWRPDLHFYNGVKLNEPGSLVATIKDPSNHAILMSNGLVLFIPPIEDTVMCDTAGDLSNWPWGEYECNIKIGSWTYDSYMMNIKHYGNNNIMDDTQQTNGIHVEDLLASSPFAFTENSFKEDPIKTKFYDCCPEPYSHIGYRFNIQRRFRYNSETGAREENPNKVPEYHN